MAPFWKQTANSAPDYDQTKPRGNHPLLVIKQIQRIQWAWEKGENLSCLKFDYKKLELRQDQVEICSTHNQNGYWKEQFRCGFSYILESFIDAQINSLLDVHLDSHLISLDLHCNNISVIKNFYELKHLKHLDLSSNIIAKMRGLGGLTSIKTVNLACNELQVVEGLENLG